MLVSARGWARTLLLSAICVGLFASAPAEAAKREILYLELNSFLAKTLADKKHSYSPITIVLGIPGKEYIGYVCRMMPRLRDVVVSYYNDYPIPIKLNGHLKLLNNPKRLIKRINKSLKGGYVWRVYIAEGARTGLSKPAKTLGLKIGLLCHNGLILSAE